MTLRKFGKMLTQAEIPDRSPCLKQRRQKSWWFNFITKNYLERYFFSPLTSQISWLNIPSSQLVFVQTHKWDHSSAEIERVEIRRHSSHTIHREWEQSPHLFSWWEAGWCWAGRCMLVDFGIGPNGWSVLAPTAPAGWRCAYAETLGLGRRNRWEIDKWKRQRNNGKDTGERMGRKTKKTVWKTAGIKGGYSRWLFVTFKREHMWHISFSYITSDE